MSSPTVFVCGATGTQGGALTHHLLAKNISIHAITRTEDSASAQRLKSQGVSLSKGDFDDEESLQHAMINCTALFLNLNPDFAKPNGELEQAKHLIKVAKDVGITQIIYSSAIGINNPEKLSHWNPASPMAKALLVKQAVENEVKNAGFDNWTILRPGNFMSNFLDPRVRMYQGLVETRKFTTAFRPETKLPMVDPKDIGRFAAAAILDPARFNQHEIEVTSELKGGDELMQDLSRATGKEFQAVFLSDSEIQEQLPKNFVLGPQMLMRDMSQFVDLDNIKRYNVELGSFAQFLEREKEHLEKTFS